MIRHIFARVRRALPASASSTAKLQSQVDELRRDINELRMDNLRIAQLHDVVVDNLAEIERTKANEGNRNV